MAKEASSGESSRYHVPNLERALSVFEILAEHSEGLTQSEIASLLGIPRNSAFRITLTLNDFGYLTRDEVTKKFSLSPKLLKIGYAAVGESKLIEKSIDIMKLARDEINESVLIGTFLQSEGIVMETLVGGGLPFKVMVDPGSRFRLTSSAPGKSMLYHLPAEERKELLKQETFTVYTKNTIRSLSEFETHIAEWGKKGYFIDDEEEFSGLRCVGAPIFDRAGHVTAALWVSAPVDRLPQERVHEVGTAIKRYAHAISERLGYLDQ
ncbi:IclR family transcriptional regulator [Coraliomargarita akajimensis]|uniref:Transcriptional regulator, IclR family n=1 Tax=Coraliomargarita akajimensis (strain DSM 45221 / IAM 15411 / JCM 23193 / KCTC 12865 / 04OKA010-24) TaxID=583355 RepID=D5EN33_CORAD|nr:IclR family transcriptional regulator [Coraliomargarita akajimensis]ADE53468.1 transcriptional regulator, IclR family [Coraliomargarita akajimensis DSM 45221]